MPFTDLTGSRVLQFLLDSLITFAISLVGLVALVPGFVAGRTSLVLLGVVVWLLGYYVASAWVEVFHPHRRDGQTYGMSVLELRVVDEATLGPPTTGQLALRWLMLLLVDGGVIALILMLVTEKHQRVGDLLAKTLVVRADEPLVAETRRRAPGPQA